MAAPNATSADTVRLKDIADVTRNDAAKRFTSEQESGTIEHYKKKMHTRRIPEECEPSAAQLGVLNQLLEEGGAPGVDFGLWGPHEKRTAKALSYQALVLESSGGQWGQHSLLT